MAPRPADPTIDIQADCPRGLVCITEESAISLALWIRAVHRRDDDVDACPYVKTYAP